MMISITKICDVLGTDDHEQELMITNDKLTLLFLMSEFIPILQKVGVFELISAHRSSNDLYGLKCTAYQSLPYSLLMVNTLPKGGKKQQVFPFNSLLYISAPLFFPQIHAVS